MLVGKVREEEFSFDPVISTASWSENLLQSSPILATIPNLCRYFFATACCLAVGAAVGILAKKTFSHYHILRSLARTVQEFEASHPRALIVAVGVACLVSVFFPAVGYLLAVVAGFRLGCSYDSLQPLRDRLRWVRRWWSF